MSSTESQPPATPQPADGAPSIEAMSAADLLEAVEISLDSARSYLAGAPTDQAVIAVGDCIDALDHLLVVVGRLASGEARR
jgi:hypothetical protein